MNFIRLNKQEFEAIISYFNIKESIGVLFDDFYDIYNTTCDLIFEVFNTITIKQFSPINPTVLILYILYEAKFYFSLEENRNSDVKKTLSDDDFKNYFASIVADKYLTNEQFDYKSQSFLNKFNPQISTITLYLNFILNVISNLKDLDKYQKLLTDLLKNCFSLGKCMVSLLTGGFDVEAFSTWRTMHENECIIYCLTQNGQAMFDEYFKHIEYSLAYRNQIQDKEKNDLIFKEIKEKMHLHGLKSKDTKKFIEYGYLFLIPNKEFNIDFKLNFRDGVQNLVGLKRYSKTYELSSEVAHSSPLLIYSNREYYFNIAISNLYESFFRLEVVFHDLYKKLSNEIEELSYSKMRTFYLEELKKIYDQLNNDFALSSF